MLRVLVVSSCVIRDPCFILALEAFDGSSEDGIVGRKLSILNSPSRLPYPTPEKEYTYPVSIFQNTKHFPTTLPYPLI